MCQILQQDMIEPQDIDGNIIWSFTMCWVKINSIFSLKEAFHFDIAITSILMKSIKHLSFILIVKSVRNTPLKKIVVSNLYK